MVWIFQQGYSTYTPTWPITDYQRNNNSETISLCFLWQTQWIKQMHEISIHFLLFRIWGAVPDGPSYSLQCTVLLINSFHSVPLIDMGGTHKGEAVKYFIFCKQKVIQQTFFFSFRSLKHQAFISAIHGSCGGSGLDSWLATLCRSDLIWNYFSNRLKEVSLRISCVGESTCI